MFLCKDTFSGIGVLDQDQKAEKGNFFTKRANRVAHPVNPHLEINPEVVFFFFFKI